ncbi:MAG TPA: alternative ribosome rescue aminoacyl-tRNA hydrolase ArfB [Novosphingobium sp.]|nr:alternative ribosome rescue aminoacyl-tRNA hydrolase ArfB [Novosphingobium sp.]
MPLIQVSSAISIDDRELVESTTRASGPGGQHVNTTDSAVILRFDVANSPNLPQDVKERLLKLAGARLTRDGIIVLRSESTRSQLVNREEVRARLFELIREAEIRPKRRRPTKPTKASQKRRIEGKLRRSTVKEGRGRVNPD